MKYAVGDNNTIMKFNCSSDTTQMDDKEQFNKIQQNFIAEKCQQYIEQNTI